MISLILFDDWLALILRWSFKNCQRGSQGGTWAPLELPEVFPEHTGGKGYKKNDWILQIYTPFPVDGIISIVFPNTVDSPPSSKLLWASLPCSTWSTTTPSRLTRTTSTIGNHPFIIQSETSWWFHSQTFSVQNDVLIKYQQIKCVCIYVYIVYGHRDCVCCVWKYEHDSHPILNFRWWIFNINQFCFGVYIS